MTARTLVDNDLYDNPTPRLPVALVLDCSPSMSGRLDCGAPVEQTDPSPLDELNAGVRLFYGDVLADDISVSSAEIAVVAYAGSPVVLRTFASVEAEEAPTLEVIGNGTDIGSAVLVALELLDNRKLSYQEAGLDYYQPWLVLMTDGYPTHGPHAEAAAEIQKRIAARKIVTFPVGIGVGADFELLRGFVEESRSPFRLDGLNFQRFFKWLSASLSNTSASTPGDEPQAPAWPTKPDEPW